MDIFNSWLVNNYVAHRGLHDSESPENSLSAFQKAIDKGYTIELDIHPIEDGTPVVFHDDTLKRLTNEDGYIKKVKNVKELKKFRLLKTKEKIPTLQEVLDFVNGKTPLIIELKDYDLNSNFESRVYSILKSYKGDYAIMSFNPYTLKWFRLNAPYVLRGQLSCKFKCEKLGLIKKFILSKMILNKKVSQPNFIAYKYDDIPNKAVNKYNNLPLLVWAVPSQSEYMKVAPFCDNIIFENFEPKI